MSLNDLYQFLLFASITLLIIVPLGAMFAALLRDRAILLPGERAIHALAGVRAEIEQNWQQYLAAVLGFNLVGFVFLYLLLLFQHLLPLNPTNLPGLDRALAFNIAVSFVTNTNWQSYAGEQTLSMLSQMLGLTVQNFLSAATGAAIAAAMVRGFTRRETRLLGNFYVDMTRVTLYVLLPLSILFAIFLISQGVPENFRTVLSATTLEGVEQTIPGGPVASQIAIKMLGSNGGGYFTANAAHPYENPTPLSILVQLISIVALPGALVFAFGRLVGDKRQGRALFLSMSLLFLAVFTLSLMAESGDQPQLLPGTVDTIASDTNPGGNMEGKEMRAGIFNSSLWATLTTATSNGSVIAAHESLMPLSALTTLFNMQVGGVTFGGVGCGLYGILVYVIITVFIAGLMVGRTPEYLGKKIEAHEIKLAMGAQLLYPLCMLGFAALSLFLPAGVASMSEPGAHGLTQTLYAYASAASNNGSSFGSWSANTDYQNIMLGIVMLIGRFGFIAFLLAIAGALAMKKAIPASAGTLPTHGALFIVMLAAVIIMFDGLTYFPALALGPIAQHLSLFAGGN